MTFDLAKVKVTQNFAQFPPHYVINAPAKFAVAPIIGIGGDAFTRNVKDRPMHAHMDGQTMDWLIKNKYTLFSKDEAGMINRFHSE